MSRARGPSVVHAVADDLDQAIEDITHDWSTDRQQQWITRTAQPGLDPSIQTVPDDADTRRARLLAELEALERHAPPDVTAELLAARADLERLRHDRDDLARGTGRWQHKPMGRVARQLGEADRARQHAERWMDQPGIGRRERHRWRRLASGAARTEALAEHDWVIHGRPVADHLDRKINRAEQRVAELEGQARFRARWLAEQPELTRRIEHARRDLRRLHDPLAVELLERIEALAPHRDEISPTAQRPEITRLRQRLDRLQRTRDIEPPGLSL
jgi:hypothetical protein